MGPNSAFLGVCIARTRQQRCPDHCPDQAKTLPGPARSLRRTDQAETLHGPAARTSAKFALHGPRPNRARTNARTVRTNATAHCTDQCSGIARTNARTNANGLPGSMPGPMPGPCARGWNTLQPFAMPLSEFDVLFKRSGKAASRKLEAGRLGESGRLGR